MTLDERIQEIINEAFVGKTLSIEIMNDINISHSRSYVVSTSDLIDNDVFFNKSKAGVYDILALMEAIRLADNGTYTRTVGFGTRITYTLT